MSGHMEREALLKHLDLFLHSNPNVDLSGVVCKHGLAIEACPSRECGNPMAYETAIKRARDYIAADSHAELVKALEEMIAEFAVDDAQCDCRVCSITNRARAALATLTARKVG